MTDQLVSELVELNEEFVINRVKELKQAGTSALEILGLLQEGMEEVGHKFETNEYFLSELIMSGDIFKSAAAELDDAFQENDRAKLGTMLIGTVKEDVHDIGKDIVTTILSCNGFQVIDLGVDVPAEQFVEAIRKHNPQIIGMSCLLTTAFDSMKHIIASIETEGLRDGRTILIGGGPITQSVVEFVHADGFCTNAQEAVHVCKKIVGKG